MNQFSLSFAIVHFDHQISILTPKTVMLAFSFLFRKDHMTCIQNILRTTLLDTLAWGHRDKIHFLLFSKQPACMEHLGAKFPVKNDVSTSIPCIQPATPVKQVVT